MADPSLVFENSRLKNAYIALQALKQVVIILANVVVGGGGGGGGGNDDGVASKNSESNAKRSKSDDETNAKRSKLDDESSIEKDAAKKADANEFDKTIGDGNQKQSKENVKPPECPKDYIHVRARRGQATDARSLAKSVRIYKIFAFEDSGYRILYDNICLDRFD
ncbi:BHLH domain-containing protein [Forsythia ovata]|uniref:BHLH domain-containing protein n=1 Tax=Forsythia ovata TaxID=205694 RepID=A0ABD1X5M9_9LAMI